MKRTCRSADLHCVWFVVCGLEMQSLHTSWPAADHLCDVRTCANATTQVLYILPRVCVVDLA